MSAVTENGPLLCVEEVTRLFKISCTKAYKEAQLYIESASTAGIPAVRIGRSIRFLSEPIEAPTAGGQRSTPATSTGIRRRPATCTKPT